MQSMLGSGIFEAGQGVDVAGTCAMFCVSTKGIIPELSKPGTGLIFNSGTLPDTYFYWGFVRTAVSPCAGSRTTSARRRTMLPTTAR